MTGKGEDRDEDGKQADAPLPRGVGEHGRSEVVVDPGVDLVSMVAIESKVRGRRGRLELFHEDRGENDARCRESRGCTSGRDESVATLRRR